MSDTSEGAGWGVGLRVWVERAGRAVVGPEHLLLLEAIDRHASISAAGRALGIPYRRAWEMVQGMNEAAGEPLVAAAPGGPRGGGARLTPLGRWAVVALRDVQGHLGHTAAALAPRLVEGARRTLHVAAAVSLDEVLGQLLIDFAALYPGQPVRTVYGASDELADHLLAGSPGDVFLTADPRQTERLAAARRLRPGAAVPLAENGLAAVTASESGVSVRGPADLAPLRVALARPDCPLGRYTRAYLEGLHLYEALLPRAVRVEDSRAVLTAVRAGQADAGVVYSSDAARAARCRTLFAAARPPIPIRYSGSLLEHGTDPVAARTLLDFLASPEAAERFRGCGFLPPSPHS